MPSPPSDSASPPTVLPVRAGESSGSMRKIQEVSGGTKVAQARQIPLQITGGSGVAQTRESSQRPPGAIGRAPGSCQAIASTDDSTRDIRIGGSVGVQTVRSVKNKEGSTSKDRTQQPSGSSGLGQAIRLATSRTDHAIQIGQSSVPAGQQAVLQARGEETLTSTEKIRRPFKNIHAMPMLRLAAVRQSTGAGNTLNPPVGEGGREQSPRSIQRYGAKTSAMASSSPPRWAGASVGGSTMPSCKPGTGAVSSSNPPSGPKERGGPSRGLAPKSSKVPEPSTAIVRSDARPGSSFRPMRLGIETEFLIEGKQQWQNELPVELFVRMLAAGHNEAASAIHRRMHPSLRHCSDRHKYTEWSMVTEESILTANAGYTPCKS